MLGAGYPSVVVKAGAHSTLRGVIPAPIHSTTVSVRAEGKYAPENEGRGNLRVELRYRRGSVMAEKRNYDVGCRNWDYPGWCLV